VAYWLGEEKVEQKFRDLDAAKAEAELAVIKMANVVAYKPTAPDASTATHADNVAIAPTSAVAAPAAASA
jgi:hypothetical protein